MRNNVIIMLVAILLLMTGCTSAEYKPTTLGKEYPGNIEQVTKVTIVSGSTGGGKDYTEPDMIIPWIEKVKDIVWEPDPNQEARDGFLFSIYLYEGNKRTFACSLGSIGSAYYVVDQQMLELTEQLFEDHE